MSSVPIKVVRIFSRLNVGGPSLHVNLLSQELSKNYETILVTGQVSDWEGDMSYLLESKKNFRHILIPELGRNVHFWRDFIAFWKILKLLREEKPDIVHTHTAKAGILGRAAALIAGVPVRVHTFHGHIFSGYFGKLKTSLIILVERTLAFFTSQIVAISPRQKKELVYRYRIAKADKVSVIPLGLDLTYFGKPSVNRNEALKKFSLPMNTYLVGIIGRLVPIKNHLFFLEVAKKIVRVRKDVHFIIVGGGELLELLQKKVRAFQLQNDVTFLGWQRELKPIYDILDIVCLTSLNEGTPVSLIEAQACGKPIVATRVGGVEDVVFSEKNGYLTSIDDIEGFSQKVMFLLDQPDIRDKMKQFSQTFVKTYYTKEILLKNMDCLYQKILFQRNLL